MRSATRLIPALLLFGLLPACRGPRAQLERVAKDWAMTIRASQVAPVYPLTEDLQPGDVFLTQLPIDRQQEIYEREGFLPLDNHVARLDPKGYAEFYARAFRTGFGEGQIPRSQQRPPQGRSWSEAPQAGFSSYSFSVRRGGGLSLALPIQGVPVGLGLMGAEAVEGSVCLEQTRTLGIDTVSLHAQVQEWARAHRPFLEPFGASPARNFLRVVQRVYLAGQVDVSLRSADQAGAGADVAKASPLALLAPEPPEPGAPAKAAEGYADALEKLNESIAGALAAAGGAGGGSLRITAASARSVSMSETLDPPLVFGYLGFDVAILPGGDLGPPIPTHANLSRQVDLARSPELARAFELAQASVTRRVYFALRALAGQVAEAKERVAALDALETFVPARETVYRASREDVLIEDLWTREPATPGYLAFHDWRGRLELSRRVLDRLLAGDRLRAKAGDGEPAERARGSEEWQALVEARDRFARLLADPAIDARLREASRAAWRAFHELHAQGDGPGEVR